MTIRANLNALDRRRRKGTPDQVRELRRRVAAGERIVDIAKEYPWSECQCRDIAARKAWREVP